MAATNLPLAFAVLYAISVVHAQHAQFPCPEKKPANLQTGDLKISQATVTANGFSSVCQISKLPVDDTYHAVAIESIVDKGELLPIIRMFGCAATDVAETRPGACSSGDRAKCNDLLAVSAAGSKSVQCFPSVAGLLFGKKSYKYARLEVIYSNDGAQTVDSSGMRMYYTSSLRPYDIDLLELQQEDLLIPKGTTGVQQTATCTAQCTRTLLAKGNINVVSAVPFMRKAGSSAKVENRRAGGVSQTVLDISNYNPRQIQWTKHDPPLQVASGDQLLTTCTYNNPGQTTLQNDDEDCLAFLLYYPKRGDLKCTQRGLTDECFRKSTVCGESCPNAALLNNLLSNQGRFSTVCAGPCSQPCADLLLEANTVEQDKCLQVRHKVKYDEFLKAMEKVKSGRQMAETACQGVRGNLPTPQNVPGQATIGETCPSSLVRQSLPTTQPPRTTSSVTERPTSVGERTASVGERPTSVGERPGSETSSTTRSSQAAQSTRSGSALALPSKTMGFFVGCTLSALVFTAFA